MLMTNTKRKEVSQTETITINDTVELFRSVETIQPIESIRG